MLSSSNFPSARLMAKALTVPSLSSPTRSVSLAEYRRVPAAIQSQAARARAHLVDAGGRHRPGGAIHLKEVNAATIAGRQIHLGRQHIAERRTEGSDIGEEWSGGFVRLRLEQTGHERCCPRKCDRGFQKRTSGAVACGHGECGLSMGELHKRK